MLWEAVVDRRDMLVSMPRRVAGDASHMTAKVILLKPPQKLSFNLPVIFFCALPHAPPFSRNARSPGGGDASQSAEELRQWESMKQCGVLVCPAEMWRAFI
jgi:hypothetical protein